MAKPKVKAKTATKTRKRLCVVPDTRGITERELESLPLSKLAALFVGTDFESIVGRYLQATAWLCVAEKKLRDAGIE